MLCQLSYAGPCGMERETGIEPATNRLEICDSTIELLPQNPFHSSKGCHPACNSRTCSGSVMCRLDTDVDQGTPRLSKHGLHAPVNSVTQNDGTLFVTGERSRREFAVRFRH